MSHSSFGHPAAQAAFTGAENQIQPAGNQNGFYGSEQGADPFAFLSAGLGGLSVSDENQVPARRNGNTQVAKQAAWAGWQARCCPSSSRLFPVFFSCSDQHVGGWSWRWTLMRLWFSSRLIISSDKEVGGKGVAGWDARLDGTWARRTNIETRPNKTHLAFRHSGRGDW